jgi:AAA family ATP:ADP antiporter
LNGIEDNLEGRDSGGPGRTWLIFVAASSLMLAHQVAGKALRDGLFLSRFAASDLPKIVAASALVAVLLGLGFARILGRYGPFRVVPIAFGAGAVMHLAEYLMLQSPSDEVRSVVITLVYLHLVGFGAILLSGFWSIANEFFDPREAKLRFGRIAGAGTIGGIAGGLMAERTAAMFGVDAVLLLLTGLHVAAAVTLWRIPPDHHGAKDPHENEPVWQAARDAFRQAPFLVNLAVLVLMGTMSAAMLDYLFKSVAAAEFGKGPALTRYFAAFYTANQILSFAVQAFLTPAALSRFGLGKTVRLHPLAVAFGAGASLFGPKEIMAPVARGLELVLRGSFLRSGYELFFTPVPPREKRAVKTFIDVGCDRMGDAFGAGILYLLLLLGPTEAITPILLVAIGLALIGAWITSRMDAAYIAVLQHGLLSRAIEVNEAEIQDSTTLSTVMRTFRPPSFQGDAPAQARPTVAATVPPPFSRDTSLSRLVELRSGIPRRVTAAFSVDLPFDSLLVPQAIRLLAWNQCFEASRAFLLLHGHRAVGQLVDELLDPEQDFAVRRRIPRILAYTSSQRAVDGLIEVLTDVRFEIRYHASRALEFLHRMGEGLRFDKEAVMNAVKRELSIANPAGDTRKLLDTHDESDSQYWFLDDVLKDRASKSLELVFSLLALHLPGEPLRVAFRALHSEDRMLRALALEYLESNVSGEIVSKLAGLAEPAAAGRPARQPKEVLEELMASQQTILTSLSDQR